MKVTGLLAARLQFALLVTACSLKGSHPGLSPAESHYQDTGNEALAVLERAKSTIDSNCSAARSVVLSGAVEARGRIVQPGDPEIESPVPDPKPFDRRGTFKFVASDFGEKKRWEKAWTGSSGALYENRALVRGIVLDAAEKDYRGYLRPGNHFLLEDSDNLDFYRDHWRVLEIDRIMELVRRHPDQCTVEHLEDGTIAVNLRRSDDPNPNCTVEIMPQADWLVRRIFDPKNRVYYHEWKWQRDATTNLWHQARLVSVYKIPYPSGLLFEETIVLIVQQARFNEAIPEETFTFVGLGLKPGTPVIDMRVTPHVRYVFCPSAKDAEAVVEGVVAPPVAKAALSRTPKRTGRRWVLVSITGVMVFLLAALLGFRYVRASRTGPGRGERLDRR